MAKRIPGTSMWFGPRLGKRYKQNNQKYSYSFKMFLIHNRGKRELASRDVYSLELPQNMANENQDTDFVLILPSSNYFTQGKFCKIKYTIHFYGFFSR
jgi:predicted membrane-bound spermidine synthase